MENTPSLLDRHRPTADCAVGWMCRCAAHCAGAVRILLDPTPPPHPPSAFLPGVALPLVACLPQLPVMGFLSNQQPCKRQSMGVNYLPIGGNALLQAGRESVTKKQEQALPGKRGPMTLCKGTVAITFTTPVKPTLCIDRKKLPSDEISAILFNAR